MMGIFGYIVRNNMKNLYFIILLSFSCVPVQKVSPISDTDLFNKTVPAVVVVYSFDKTAPVEFLFGVRFSFVI